MKKEDWASQGEDFRRQMYTRDKNKNSKGTKGRTW